MKRAVSLLLSLALLLSLVGCGFVFPGSYSAVTPYVEQKREDEDKSILRAENYTELLNSVQYFVSQGMPEGVVRLYQYEGDVERDLDKACQEVLMDDPVGTYALEEISGTCQHIVTYYECTVSCVYRRTAEQIAAIRRVNGTAAIRSAIAEALRSRDTELALEVSAYFAEEEMLRALTEEAYCENPAYAVEYPEITCTVYPSTGSSRVVELTFGWSTTAEALNERVEEVRESAAALISEAGVNGLISLDRLCALLERRLNYSAAGAKDVYAALNGEEVDSLGAALTLQLLCSLSGIPCQVVSGTLDSAAHWWNIVTVQDGFAHIDLTQSLPQGGFLRYDEGMEEHYSWDTTAYPACPSPEGTEEEPSGGEAPEQTPDASDDGAPKQTPDVSGDGAVEKASDASGDGGPEEIPNVMSDG